MELAYEVWRTVMYGVGVFVTCNIGGNLLLMGVGRVSKPRTADGAEGDSGHKLHPFDDCSFDEMARYSEEEPAHVEAEPVTPHSGQDFADMQRQIAYQDRAAKA